MEYYDSINSINVQTLKKYERKRFVPKEDSSIVDCLCEDKLMIRTSACEARITSRGKIYLLAIRAGRYMGSRIF